MKFYLQKNFVSCYFFTFFNPPNSKITMKKIFVIAFTCLGFSFYVKAQNESILKEINNSYTQGGFFDQDTKTDVIKEVNQQESDTSGSKADESADLEKDTTELFSAENVIEVEQVDSSLYKDEVLFPEKQVPVKVLKREKDWEKEFLITNHVSYKQKHELDSNFKVFGWHPYWMGTAFESYNFSLLSMVAYFSYEVNPHNGSYKSIHNWKTTALVDSAKANGSKVLLSISNFGANKNKIFLNNVKAQKNLIRTIITLLKERNADGVNLDFEGIREKEREELNNFIIDLSSSLKIENSNYVVTVAIPAFDFNNVYNIPIIESHVDLFVIMGYEFHGVKSKTAGPISPLTSGNRWMPLNLERSVDEYLVAGIPPEKLILGLSYYGVEWQTYDLKFPSKAKKFERYHTYRSVKKITKNYSCVIDEPSLSKYYAYRDADNNYRQIWFDDSLTLSMKYDWIKDKKIGGAGIWALGYDNGHDELWKLIAKKFAYDEKEQKAKKRGFRMSMRRMLNLTFRLIRNPSSLLTRPRPVMMLFGGLFGMSMAGFFLIYRYGHRFSRLLNITLKGTISIIIIIGIALVFIIFRYIKIKEVYFLLGGIVFGLLLFYLFSRRFISEKELP